jgi:glycine oxidase
VLKKRESIVLIGAGVIGMLAAVRLAEAGFAVTVVDQGQIGREASWAGGGILSPLYPWHYPPELLRLSFYSMSLHHALASELASLTSIDPQWTLSGLRIIEGENEVFPNDVSHWGQNWGLNWHKCVIPACYPLWQSAADSLISNYLNILKLQALNVKTNNCSAWKVNRGF